MTKHNKIQIFSDRKVRTIWDSDNEQWYFSIIDVIIEGYQSVTNCNRLKLKAADGKMRLNTD